MNGARRTWAWVAIGAAAVALSIYLNRRQTSAPSPAPGVLEPAADEPAAAFEPAPEPPPAVPDERTASPSAPPAPSVTATTDNGRPPCTSDAQCKGPRHAECIDIRCVSGKCIYDESRCECVSHEDCDDGNPCTRNHCFSSTQKCIYIPIDDCKP